MCSYKHGKVNQEASQDKSDKTFNATMSPKSSLTPDSSDYLVNHFRLCHTTSLHAVIPLLANAPVHLGKLSPEAPVQISPLLQRISYSLYLYKINCFFLPVPIALYK